MSRSVILRTDFTEAAFAPFGTVIAHPDTIGERRMYSQWLGGDGLSPVFHVNAVAPAILPHRVSLLERHPHANQAFIPLDVSRYLVTVAPSDENGQPQLDALVSFLVPGNLGVVYGRGIWHGGACVLDRLGHFSVLMWRGKADDDVMLDVEDFTILPPAGFGQDALDPTVAQKVRA
jgi:ureidoglycolate lyase